MQDEAKTKDQLITELHELRERVAELEKIHAKRKRVEKALKESDGKYRRLAESIPGMVFQYVLHQDGSFALPYVNERIMQYAGILPETAMAEPSLIFTPIHHDDLEMVHQAISISAQTLNDFSVEHRLIDVNGRLRWFRVESTPQRLSNGDILWNGVSIDITEHKQTEDALRESKAYLTATIESIPYEFWVMGPDGCYTMQNRVSRERYGDAVGKRAEDVCPNESMLSVWQDNNRRAFAGEVVKGEVRFVFGNEERYFYNVVAPIHDRDRICGILGINVHITERKQAEESLQLSEDRYRRLFEDAVLGIYRTTAEGKIIDVNPAFARMYGFDSPEEAKSLVNDVAVDLYVDPSRRDEIVNTILNAKGPICAEMLYKRKDGGVFSGNLHVWAVRDREGKLLYLEGFVEDVTERKLVEDALQKSKAYLAATIESIPFEFWVMGPEGYYTMQNRIIRDRYGDIVGKRPEDVCPNESTLSVWQDNNRRAFAGELVQGEVRFVFGSEERYFYNVVAPIHDADRTLGIVGINVDITNRKFLEAALKNANENLESQVEERTKELRAQTRRLEEFNAALKVLLEQREVDKLELEESILLNLKSLITPYVEKLKKSRLGGDQMTYLNILESHMREITSPFTRRLSEKYVGLTPVEIQTVGLIKEGKTTQEIAGLLCVSENTVSSNRFHIRKKLGLTKKKVNLRNYLNNIDKR